MLRSPLLESFDPLATHRFTNGCGVLPQPPPPSLYPIPIPSSHSQPEGLSTSSTSSSSSKQSSNFTAPLHRPQPQRPSPSSPATPSRQIFVPFRKDASSPDLVLKKHSLSGAMIHLQAPTDPKL